MTRTVEMARRELREAKERREPREEEDAPLDTPVVAWFQFMDEWVIARKVGNTWRSEWDMQEMADLPSHFRPIPDPPEAP